MDVLYYSPGAASMVVHWLLIELGTPYELRLCDTSTGAQKSPEYLALNPNGVVPTLILDGVPRIGQAWDRLDAHLGKHGPYMLGDRISAADFYLAMLMRWSRNMPKPATAWPNLLAFADRMRARPSFAKLYELEGLDEWGNAPATTTA